MTGRDRGVSEVLQLMHEVFSPETGAPLDGAVGAADQGCGESLTTWLAAPWCGSWQQALGSPLLHAPDLRDAWPDSSAIGASSWANPSLPGMVGVPGHRGATHGPAAA